MKKGIDEVYTPEVLKRLQDTELDILKKFDAMSQKYGMKYCCLFGTTLGQVRHGGFIPWDDDIDIAVMREDYEKLKELVPKEFGDGYKFVDGSTEPRYPFSTGRIMKKGTEFRMLSMKNCKFESGIFLDLFCFDWLPDDPKKLKKAKRRCWVAEKMNVLRNMPFPNLPYKGFKFYLVRAACAVAAFFMKILPRKFLQKRVKKAAQVMGGKETNTIGWPFGIKPDKNIYARDVIFPLQRKPFEDMTVGMPNDPDKMLRQQFGPDYMTPLPEGQRSFIVPYKLSFGDEPAEEKSR